MRKVFDDAKGLFARSSALVLLFCIAAKSVLIFFYSYYGRDKISHLAANHNLFNGKGWNHSFYSALQPGHEILEPFCWWPPGYGLLVAPLQYLTNNNLFLATTLVEVFFFIVFILLCRAILRTQRVSGFWLNMSTILLCFFPHDFIEGSLGTDLPALCFMLGFFYSAIRIWNRRDRPAITGLGALAGFCLFAAAFTRYMYVPVAVVAVALMLVLAYWKQNRKAVRGYLVCAIVCMACLAAATAFQSSSCTDPFYVGTKSKGLFPSQLQYWHPAILAAFTNLNLLATLLQKTGPSFLFFQQLFSWINLAIYPVLIIVAARNIPRIKRSGAADFPVFEVVGFLLSAAIVAELAALSLTNSYKIQYDGVPWTFIMEGRYHAFVVVFVQLFFFSRLSVIGGLFRKGNRLSYLMGILLVIYSLASLHQVYYTAKVASNFRVMKKSVEREMDYVFVESLLKQTIKENPGKEVFVASLDSFYPMLASIYNAKGIKGSDQVDQLRLNVKSPAVLIVIFFKPQLDGQKVFIERDDVTFIGEKAGAYIYRQLINPAPLPNSP